MRSFRKWFSEKSFNLKKIVFNWKIRRRFKNEEDPLSGLDVLERYGKVKAQQHHKEFSFMVSELIRNGNSSEDLEEFKQVLLNQRAVFESDLEIPRYKEVPSFQASIQLDIEFYDSLIEKLQNRIDWQKSLKADK
jgi:hypothetical protein